MEKNPIQKSLFQILVVQMGDYRSHQELIQIQKEK